MVPLPASVKAEIGKCGSENPDYRNLRWVGWVVHKQLFDRRGKKRKYQLQGSRLFSGKGLISGFSSGLFTLWFGLDHRVGHFRPLKIMAQNFLFDMLTPCRAIGVVGCEGVYGK